MHAPLVMLRPPAEIQTPTATDQTENSTGCRSGDATGEWPCSVCYEGRRELDEVDDRLTLPIRFLTSGRLGQPSSTCLFETSALIPAMTCRRLCEIYLLSVSLRAKELSHNGHAKLRILRCT